MMTVKQCKAVQYSEWCVIADNNYVGEYVKKQCQLWLDIVNGNDNEAYFCEKTYNRICKLLKLMVHPDLNCPMYDGLEDYAWLLITAVFCTKMKSDNTRYYQTALLEICRKNFKTFTSAVVFIIAMLTEPRFSRFFSVAPDLKLSKELQVAIKKIIKSSPLLADDKVFKTLRSEIRCLLTDSEYTPLAYSQDKMDGKLANMFLADEAGAMDNYPVEAMRSSQITLFNKLGIIISTQYPNDNNVLIDLLCHERDHWCCCLTDGNQTGVKCHVCIDLILLHALCPETFTAAAYIPVAHVINKSIQSLCCLRNTVVCQIVIHILYSRIEAGKNPLIHNG